MSGCDAPAGLGAAGASLWSDITSGYGLRADESRVLEAACRQVDLIAVLDAGLVGADLLVRGSQGQQVINPLVSEVRQHRAALARLLGQLRLPDEDVAAGSSRSSSSARALANARWSKRGA